MTPLALPLALFALAAQDARPTEDLGARAQALLEELHAAGSFPGGGAAICLAEGEPLVLVVGHDVPAGRPITAADRFCAGSVGKTFFAAAALRRMVRGELDLDAKVVDLIDDPRVRALPNASDLTVRQLLRHQTGIPRYIEAPGFWTDLKQDPDREWAPGDQLTYVADAEPLFSAGEGWAYSDTNYIVLGMVLEAIAGRSAYEEVREHLLVPHGLRDTIPQDRRVLPGLVQGRTTLLAGLGFPQQALDEDGRFQVHPSFEYGGGGWVTTPRDLARWARILWSGAAFEGEYLEQVTETVPAPMLRARYGLGVIERETRAGRLLGHDGVFLGYLTVMGYFPERDVSVAFQVNQDDERGVGKPMHEVLVDLALLLGD